MPKRKNDPEQLHSTKIRTSTWRKLDLLKKLHGTRADYDMLRIAVDALYRQQLDRLTALATLLHLELPK